MTISRASSVSTNWLCGNNRSKHDCAVGTTNVSIYMVSCRQEVTYVYHSVALVPKGPVDPPPVVRLQISRSAGVPHPQQAHLRPPTTADSEQSSSSASSSIKDGQGLRSKAANPETQLTSASLIQSPYLFCFAALCKADEDEELYLLSDGKTRYVTGNVVSSLYHLKDPRDGSAEGFFVFPDIGVRVEGTFRLKLSLYEMVE